MKYILKSSEKITQEKADQQKEVTQHKKDCFSSPENESAYYFDDREMMVYRVQENLSVLKGYSNIHHMAVPYMISDREDIQQYIEAAAFAEEIPIDAGIFCIIHVPEYILGSSFQTLAFYQDGLILKSNESSSSITNRIFSNLGLKYEYMRSLISILEGKACHCRPYIYGNVCFMPVNGPSKQAVSWVNLSHLVTYGKITGEKQKVRLFFDNRHTFDMPIRYLTFEKHLQSAVESYARQHHYYFKISHLLGYHVEKRHHYYPNSILNQQLVKYQPYKREISLEEWIKKFQVFSLKNLLKESSFKENPLAEEITESLKQRYFLQTNESDFP